MKPNFLLLLMVAFLVLGTFAFFDPFKAKREHQDDLDNHVVYLKNKKITSIQVTNDKYKALFHCTSAQGCDPETDGHWTVSWNDQSDAGDSANIGAFVNMIKNLSATEKLDVTGVADFKEYGLDKPFAQLILTYSDGQSADTITIGGATAVGPNRYAQVNANRSQLLTVADFFSKQFEKNLFHWRSKQVFPQLTSENIKTLLIDNGKSKTEFSRLESGWNITQPIKAKANQMLVEGLASTVAYLNADEIFETDIELEQVNKFLKAKPRLVFKMQTANLVVGKVFAGPPRINYLRIDGDSKVYSIDQRLFDRFVFESADYRQKTILATDERELINLVTFKFDKENKKAMFARKGLTWEQVDGDKVEQISQRRLSDFFTALSELDAAGFSTGREVAMFSTNKPDVTVELSGSQNFQLVRHFMIYQRKQLFTESDRKNELMQVSEVFAKVIPIRHADLLDKAYNQVIVNRPGDTGPHGNH